jgi:hypothetical protein
MRYTLDEDYSLKPNILANLFDMAEDSEILQTQDDVS